jgi:hypothetical protein
MHHPQRRWFAGLRDRVAPNEDVANLLDGVKRRAKALLQLVQGVLQ